MAIGLAHYLTVSAALFTIGIFGIFLNRKNVIIILMSIELILLVAMVGAIVLTLRSREGVRRQKIAQQVTRRREASVEIVKVRPRQGV